LRAEIAADALLTLWENGLGQLPSTRAEALLHAAWPGDPAPRTLGERNARLVALHQSFFGGEIELLSHCPACGATAQFGADCSALAAEMPPAGSASAHVLDSGDHHVEFRLPDGADVAAAASAGSVDRFAHRLLERCVLTCARRGEGVAVHELPAAVLDELSRRIEALDPGASVSFALACPQCPARWTAPLDIGELLWEKVRHAAERLVLDIDALARHYGWTEAEVLRLSATRRAAYLQLVGA